MPGPIVRRMTGQDPGLGPTRCHVGHELADHGASVNVPVATSMITAFASGSALDGGQPVTVPAIEMIDLPSGDHSNAAPSATGVGPIDRVAPPVAGTTPIGWMFH